MRRYTIFALCVLVLVMLTLSAAMAGMKAQKATDPVSGKQLTVAATTLVVKVNGIPYYFQNKADKAKFTKNPEKYVKETVCPVSGTKVTVTTTTPRIDRNGDIYLFCCNMCPAKFKKDPAKYTAMAPAMSAALTGNYYCPMHPDITSKTAGKCPVCGMNMVAVTKMNTHMKMK